MSDLTAYVTTSDNTIGADAGMSVLDGDAELRRADDPMHVLDDGEGGLDAEAADEMLARLGYTRTGSWQESGGQWAAVIETAEDSEG